MEAEAAAALPAPAPRGKWRRLTYLLTSQDRLAREHSAEKLGADLAQALSWCDANEAQGDAGEDGESHHDTVTSVLADLAQLATGQDWDGRIASSKALRLAMEEFAADQRNFGAFVDAVVQSSQLGKLAAVDLSVVFEQAAPLVSQDRDAVKGVKREADLTAEREELLASLRSSFRDDFVEQAEADLVHSQADPGALLGEGDLHVRQQSAKAATTRGRKRDVSSMLRGTKGPSRREQTQKRLRAVEKKGEDAETGSPLQEVSEPQLVALLARARSSAERLGMVWTFAIALILEQRWEQRHGAACLVAQLVRANKAKRQSRSLDRILEDVMLRCICVLGMDRFGDYASDNVVAPVRESCSQLLATCLHFVSAGTHAFDTVLNLLCEMIQGVNSQVENLDATGDDLVRITTLWGRRYASLVAAKYLFAAPGVGANDCKLRAMLLPAIAQVLVQEPLEQLSRGGAFVEDTPMNNDDTRCAAAQVLLRAMHLPVESWSNEDASLDTSNVAPVAEACRLSPEGKCCLSALCSGLWKVVDHLEDAALAANGAVVQLAALCLLGAGKNDSQGVDLFNSMGSRLARHRGVSVRKTHLCIIRWLLANGGEGLLCAGSARVQDWAELILGALLHEAQGDGHVKLAKKVWASFVEHLSGPLINKCDTQEWTKLALLCLRCNPDNYKGNEGEATGRQQEGDLGGNDPLGKGTAAAAETLVTLFSALASTERFSSFLEGFVRTKVEDAGHLAIILEACTSLTLEARALGALDECTAQVLTKEDRRVVLAQRAAQDACQRLCGSFEHVGIEPEEMCSFAPGFEAVVRGDYVSSAAFLEVASKLVSEAVAAWVARAKAPVSREDAKTWNEATTALRQHVIHLVNGLKDAIKAVRLQHEALLSICHCRAALARDAAAVADNPTPWIQPLMRVLFFDTPLLLVGHVDIVATGLHRVLEAVQRVKPHHKAISKVCERLVRDRDKIKLGTARRCFQVLAKRQGPDACWDLMPAVRDVFESKLSSPCGEDDLLERCIAVLDGIVEACPTVSGVRMYIPRIMSILRTERLGSSMAETVVRFVTRCCDTPSLSGITWVSIYRELVPALSIGSEVCEASRVIVVNALERLVSLDGRGNTQTAWNELRLVSLAGLCHPLMQAMQDPGSAEVRKASGQCFASVVQLAPIESQVADPGSSAELSAEDLEFLLSRRHQGQAFLHGLLSGAPAMSSDASLQALIAQVEKANKATFREYQRQGVYWLAFLARHGLSGALCDDLGLGKTLMSLTQVAASASPESSPISLVVCPSSLTGHWVQEIESWFACVGLEPVAYVGSPAERVQVLVGVLQRLAAMATTTPPGESEQAHSQGPGRRPHIIMLVSYTVLARDVARFREIPGLEWHYVVLDEAHTIRNPYTVAAEACKAMGALAAHRLALTGTPVHNDVTDLWSVVDFLMPGFLGDLDGFEKEVAKPVRSARELLGLANSAAAAFSQAQEDRASVVATVGGPDEMLVGEGGQQGDNHDNEDEDEDDNGDDAKQGHYKRSTRNRRLEERRRKQDQMRQEAVRALESLHRRVLPFVLRRTKDQVLRDLPPKILQDVVVALEPAQEALYKEMLEDAKSSTTSESMLSRLTRLLMVCTHPLLCLRSMIAAQGSSQGRLERRRLEAKMSTIKTQGLRASSKFAALERLLRDNLLVDAKLGAAVGEQPPPRGAPREHHEVGNKVVVFAQWKGTLDLVEDQVLRGALKSRIGAVRLDGDVAAHSRQAVVNRFNTDASVKVLLATTAVGGQGLNLTAANLVVFLEHDWNPMNDLQAMDRAHRIGQRRSVNVYRVVTRDSLEAKLLSLQVFKQHVASHVVDAANSDIRRMRTDLVVDVLAAGQPVSERGRVTALLSADDAAAAQYARDFASTSSSSNQH